MRNVKGFLAASALAIVSAQALATTPVTLTGTGVNTGTYLGFPINGTQAISGSGTYDATTGISTLSFSMTQTNTDPFYAAGVLSISGTMTLDDGSVSGTVSGTTHAASCSVVSGANTCSYVGVGTTRSYNTVTTSGSGVFQTTLVDSITGATVTQNLTVQ